MPTINVSNCRYVSDSRSRGRELDPARPHTFVEFDHEIFSSASADSRMVVSYERNFKVCARSTGQPLCEASREKNAAIPT